METGNSSSSPLSFRQLRDNARSRHALGLLESLQSLREERSTCDFVVKVGDDIFPVHRSVLAACSDYFKAMFEHDMMEATKGVVDMKEVQRDAVEKCISFMYTGVIDVDFTNVQDILHVASLLQVTNLMHYCFDYMQMHITPENCLFVQKLSKNFCKEEEQRKAEEFAKNNLSKVIISPDFVEVSFTELIRFVKSSSQAHHVIWQAVITWIKSDTTNRSNCLSEILQCIGLSKFPVKYLLSTLLEENLLMECKVCRDLVIKGIYGQFNKALTSIEIQNCYDWKHFTKTFVDHENAKVFARFVDSFMVKNFEKIANDARFLDLSSDDILQFTKSEASTIFIWKSLLRWVKHADDRQHHLPVILKSLNFENITVDCIQDIFMTESLVKQSHECKDILIDVTFSKVKTDREKASGVGQGVKKLKSGVKLVPVPRHVSKQKADVSQSKNVIALLDTDNNSISCTQLGTNLSDWTHYSLPLKTKLMRVVSLNDSLHVLCNDQLFLFDTNSWKELKDHPILPDKRTHVFAFQNRIYTLDFEDMYYYYPVTDKWSPKLPVANIEVDYCVASSSEYIYVMGGHSLQKGCVRYTPVGKQSKRWTEISEMNEKRNNAAAACLDGVIYVLGGLVGSQAVKSVECYNPEVGHWTYFSSMRVCRRRFSAFVADGQLFAVGGAFEENGKDRKKTARFD